MSSNQTRCYNSKACGLFNGVQQSRCIARSRQPGIQCQRNNVLDPHSNRYFPRLLSNRFFSTSHAFRHDLKFKSDSQPDSSFIEQELRAVYDKAHRVLTLSTIPSERATQESLKACKLLAEALADGVELTERLKTPTSTLLDLEERRKRNDGTTSNTRSLPAAIRRRAVEKLSTIAYSIVTSPQVFITSELLSSYVRVQSLLGHPETIPPVFILYASKPVPLPNTSPIQYRKLNSNKASFAVPLAVSKAALTAAIDKRDLSICFDIINTSVCTTAFRRSKFVKKALAPVSGLALAPVAAYSAASQWSLWQDTMDSEVARNVMFTGLLAYVSFTATLGIVAITTANDQMDRVTWASGTPLRERWMREDERAMIDRVAGAWGFQESWRRGEEEGRDWQSLRDWIGLRRMVLDKVELMEGME